MPIKVLSRANNRAEVLIHEPIGENWYGDGLTSKRFIQDLEALGDVSEITVRINSPGGAVWDGIAIYNALKLHAARVDVLVEGLAASAASVIAMSGDTIRMGEGSMMMIHNPWTFAMGDASDMREVADMLDKAASSLVDIYVARTSGKRGEVEALLDAETWMTASEAVEMGFADETVSARAEEEEAAAALRADHRACFAALAEKLNAHKDPTPWRIAASVFQSAKAVATPSKERPMPDIKAPASVTNADIENARREARETALKEESERRRLISDSFAPFSDAQRELRDECLNDTTCTVDAAREKLLAALGKDSQPLGPGAHIQPGRDTRDAFLQGAERALLAKMGHEKPEAGNEFNGLSLPDIAAAALSRAGISVRGLTRNQIASRVFATLTSSDFPQLASNVAGKVLRKAYGNYPNTWNKWAAAGSVSDFKIAPRIQIGSFNSLDTIVEGGEYTYGGLAEEYENAQAVTKGKAIALTRQMIVNDDLGAFNRRAQLMGRAAARSVNTDAYAYLTSGLSNHGPTSSDTGQFFNATVVTTAGGHANLTSSGTAISTTSLGIGRAAMRKQKDKSLRETLNIEPAVIATSVTKEDLARQIMTSEADPGGANSRVANIYRGRLEVVSDPYLDSIGSALSWYLFANPADVAAFEVVFLDGVQEPFVDETIDFDSDAMKFKVRLDYGVAMGDWRAAYKNVGA